MTRNQTDLRVHRPLGDIAQAGEFVLYWMQTTMRARENFAFNYAAERANELGQPVLVYQGLRRDYPWASDRLHRFILESAADIARDFRDMGVQYVFFLDRGSGEASPLVSLARRASLVVTDYYPTFIVPRQTARLRQILGASPPVVSIDSTTVIPLAHFDRQFTSARAFRPRLLEALPHYLHPVPTIEPRVRRAVEPPFDPVDFRRADLAELVSSCPIDHSVPPVPAFVGGSRAARERLARYLETGKPTTGLSPYLHFGNISPHEILLRTREAGTVEQNRHLQEQLLVWRELSHNVAHHDPAHRTIEVIPAWARQELATHAADPRPVLYPLEVLERATTDEELWDTAQRAYLTQGYMPNYLRMLWGKSVLQWTENYQQAFEVLVHLNNKYALDGRDPNSYASIAWIFGKFYRPFYRRPIYGLVRYLSLNAARKKPELREALGQLEPTEPASSRAGQAELFEAPQDANPGSGRKPLDRQRVRQRRVEQG